MSGATSAQTLSTLVGRIGVVTERLWGVMLGRAPAGGDDDAARRFCASVDELFYVEFAVDETLETVGVRLIGWDRDLTDLVGGPVRVPIGQVDEVLTRVGHVIARVTPPPYLDAVRDARKGRARLVSAPVPAVSAELALERRGVRELGGDPSRAANGPSVMLTPSVASGPGCGRIRRWHAGCPSPFGGSPSRVGICRSCWG